jgi:hypothetical protein
MQEHDFGREYPGEFSGAAGEVGSGFPKIDCDEKRFLRHFVSCA